MNILTKSSNNFALVKRQFQQMWLRNDTGLNCGSIQVYRENPQAGCAWLSNTQFSIIISSKRLLHLWNIPPFLNVKVLQNHICWNCLFTSAKLLEDFVKIFMQFYYLRCNENHELDRSFNFNVTNYYIIIVFLWTLRIKDCLLDVKSWKLIIKKLYEDYDVRQRFLFVVHTYKLKGSKWA
jgi:hypothetical protein